MPTVITPDADGYVQLPERRVSDPNFDAENAPPEGARFAFVDARVLSLERDTVPITLDTEGQRRPGWLTTYAQQTIWNEYEAGEGIRWNLIAEYPPFDFELLRPPAPENVDVYTIEHSAEVYTVDEEGAFLDSIRTITCTWTLTVRQQPAE